MSSKFRISGRQLAAARALAGVGRAHFAKASGVPIDTIRRLEAGGSAWLDSPEDLKGIKKGLDHYGVLIVDESDGKGAGVRLKFTRSDVRQITRLEGEGGIVGSDDAP